MTIKHTTCANLPYPTRDELWQRHHIVDLANGLDTALTGVQSTVDTLNARPYVELQEIVGGVSVPINTITQMAWSTGAGNIDPYKMFFGAGSMNYNSDLGIVIPRARFAGQWFVQANFFTTSTPTTMTEYRMEVMTFNPFSSGSGSAFHLRRSATGNLTNDLIAGVIPLVAGDGLRVRFIWTGSGGPYSVYCQLRLSFLGMCDDGWVYYEGFEGGTTAGWTVTNGTLASTTAWAGEGTRSLLWTPPGGVATITAIGPSITLPTYLTTTRQFYVTAGIHIGPNTPAGPINVGLQQYDSNGTFISFTSSPLPVLTANSSSYPTYAVFNPGSTVATVRPAVQYNGTPTAAQTIYIDEVSIVRACGAATSS